MPKRQLVCFDEFQGQEILATKCAIWINGWIHNGDTMQVLIKLKLSD